MAIIKKDKKALVKDEWLVLIHPKTQEVKNVIFPNGLQVGISGSADFAADLRVMGDLIVSGNLSLGVSGEDDRVGVGTDTPDYKFEVSSDVDATAEAAISQYSATVADGPNLRLRRARGSEKSPTIVASGDNLGSIHWYGHDGTDFQQAASIWCKSDTTPGADDMPGSLLFYTTPNGSTTPALRMTIKNDGKVGIGTTAPQSQLDIEGNLTVGAGYSGTSAAPTNGAIFEGKVGIGTTSPKSSLDIITGSNPLTDLGNPWSYPVYIRNSTGTNGLGTGIGFSVSTSDDDVGGAIVFDRSGGDSKGNLHFYTKQTTTGQGHPDHVMTLSDAGDVGIGTASPWPVTGPTDQTTLSIQNSDSSTSQGGSCGFLTLTRYDSSITQWDYLGAIFFGGTEDNDTVDWGAAIVAEAAGTWTVGSDIPTDLKFYTCPDGSSSHTERMRLTAFGQVGIGTDDPQSKFHVEQDDGVCYMKLSRHETDDTIESGDAIAGLYFTATENGSDYGNTALIYVNASEDWTVDSAEGSEMSFWTTKSGTASITKRLTITNDGKVGIGTDNPGWGDTSQLAGECLHIHSTDTSVNDAATLILTHYHTTLASGDNLGEIWFGGTEDNSNFNPVAAYIIAEADGTWDIPGDDCPSRIKFGVSPDGSDAPATVMTIQNDGSVGINTTAPGTKLHIKQTVDGVSGANNDPGNALRLEESGGEQWWNIGLDTDNLSDKAELAFRYADAGGEESGGGYMSAAGDAGEFTFTGQHISVPLHGSVEDFQDNIGMIVVSSGVYKNLSIDTETPTINESLPKVVLSTERNQKSVFGVLSSVEDTSLEFRRFNVGSFGTEIKKKDDRLFINSLGEGAVWVCNINGDLENGDYITSCEISGLGMKQDDDLLHNYTAAKITQDCNFDLSSTLYDTEEFEHDGQTYRKSFVGCTYHCG